VVLSDNYKCNEIRELFSPFLDGETTPEEHDLLTGHLLLCEDCRREFDLWRKISETLKFESVEEELPADFSARVVGRLHSEQKIRTFPGLKIPRTWKVPAAAAAAAVMLFAGSWGVEVALKDAGQKPAVVAENGQTGTPEENVVKTSPDPVNKPGEQEADNLAQVDQPKTDVIEKKPTEKEPTVAHTGSPSGKTALLSSNKSTASTILKISANNPAYSRDLALNMASGLGGGGQVLDSQKRDGGGELTIISMSVSRNSGSTLVSQLSGLGGILERSDSKSDITANYNTAVNRLADIQATIDSGVNAGEKTRLKSEASVLKRQIEKWDKETESYTVILWLEQQ
jgi:anti-sigma factor (TIGR02949 family)